MIQNISKGIRQNEAMVDNVKDEILRQRTEKEIEDGQELIKRIDQLYMEMVFILLEIY